MLHWVRSIRFGLPSRLELGYGLTILLIGFLYFWKLGTYTAGLNTSEAVSLNSSLSWQSISDNLVNAPYRLLQYGLDQVGIHGQLGPRLISAMLAVLFIICFWNIAKEWFGRLIGSFGALLLAATPWLIINGRLATASVMLLMPVLLLANYLWLIRTKRHRGLALLCFLITLALSIYIPGLFWIVAVGIFVARRRLLAVAKKINRWWLLSCLVLGLCLLSPLIWSLVNDWRLVKPLLLIPNHWPALAVSVKDSLWSALSIVWQTPYHVDFTIGRWPLLNVLQAVLALIGAVVMWSRARPIIYGLLAIILLAVVGSGINRDLSLLLLALPPLVLLQTAGLRYLYLEWKTIFPRNPLPQSFALVLLALLVAGQLVFAAHFALSVWPNTVATKSSYVIK